jgi:flagellin
MALSVVNNSSALNAQQNLGRANGLLSKSLERLSTGLKINRGADGPSGWSSPSSSGPRSPA